jgi:hypothetical protein
VDDLKTGWRTPEVMTPPMMFYLMVYRDWTDPDHSAESVLSITHWPKMKGEPTRDGLWRRVTPLQLEGFRME